MNKRGISPLIISVILIGVVIGLGILVYSWTSGVFDVIEKKPLYNAEFIDFKVTYLESLGCENSPNRCYGEDFSPDYYCLLIENKENFDVGYNIKTVGNSGTDISNNCNNLLEPLNSGVFRVDYNFDRVGQLDYSEVFPYRYKN